VIHISGTLPSASSLLVDNNGTPGCRGVGTLEHVPIAAVEWNREAIASVKVSLCTCRYNDPMRDSNSGSGHLDEELYDPTIARSHRISA